MLCLAQAVRCIHSSLGLALGCQGRGRGHTALGGTECLSREARKRSKIEGEDDHFEQVEGLAVQSAVKSCGLRDL